MFCEIFKKLRKNERGAVAVEMAFVLPVLLIVIFGLIAFGLLLNTYVSLIHSAREGARYAALRQDSTAVAARVTSAAPQLDAGSLAVSMEINGAPVSAATESDQGDPVEVTVTYPTPGIVTDLGEAVANIAAIFGGGALSMPATMAASATQMVE